MRLQCAFLVVIAIVMYGAILGRLSSSALILIWLEAFSFGALMVHLTLGLFWAFRTRRLKRFVPSFVAASLLLATGGLLGRFVTDRQDQIFLSKFHEYQSAVDWILENGGASPLQDRFAALASQIEVRKVDGTNVEIFFVAYPGPLGTRLRGYAYNSADAWGSNFISVYGQPKKLTNHWYRI